MRPWEERGGYDLEQCRSRAWSSGGIVPGGGHWGRCRWRRYRLAEGFAGVSGRWAFGVPDGRLSAVLVSTREENQKEENNIRGHRPLLRSRTRIVIVWSPVEGRLVLHPDPRWSRRRRCVRERLKTYVNLCPPRDQIQWKCVPCALA